MLEGLLSKYIVKFVGNYVENIDKEQLNLGILKENLELKDLILKRTALDGLDLPFSVTSGYLGKLIIKIPWTRIQSQPVIAQVTDLFIVVQPKKCKQWIEAHEREAQLESRKRRLDSYESIREQKKLQEGQSTSKEKSKDTFFTKLAEKIVHNLQVKIQTIHIRYEDTSDPDKPIIIGASLDFAGFESVNQFWEPTFVSDVQHSQFMYKLAHLKQFSVYINHNDRTLLSETDKHSFKKIISIMKQSVADHTDKTFVLYPVNGRANITIQREGKISFDLPRLKLDVQFDDVSVSLNDLQYKTILETVDYISNFEKFERFRKFKPNERPSTIASREKWWKYAYDATRLHVDSQYFTWDQVMQKLTYRDRYIGLYKRSKNLPWHKPLEKLEIDAMNRIEEMLEFEDIIYFREIANEELTLEAKAHSEYVEKKGTKKGWFSWLRGSGESYSEAAAEASKITDEQKEWLKQQIAYKEDEVSQSYKAPAEFVLVHVNITLKKGVLQLVDGKNYSTIIEGSYGDLTGEFKLRQKAHELEVNLGYFNVLDKFTRKTQFPNIAAKATTAETISEKSRHLASLNVAVNPLSGNSDLKIDLSLARLDMVCNIPLIQRVLGFFNKPSEINLESVRNATISKLASVGNQARTQLLVALQTKKFIDLNIILDAPTIIFPQDPSSPDTPIVMVDLGQFLVKSESDKKEREARLQRGEAPKEDDFYDIFSINLFDFYILFTNLPSWNRRLELGYVEGTSLLDKVNLNFNAKHSFMPMSLDRPKTLVLGSIPSININFSPSKMEKMLYLINGVLQLADDPFGKAARHNRIVHGKLSVKGKIKAKSTSDTEDLYWVEVNQSGFIHFYNDEFDDMPITSLKLDRYVEVHENVSQDEITLQLPQLDSTPVVVVLKLADKRSRLEWVGKIRMLIQDDIDKATFQIKNETDVESSNQLEEQNKLSDAIQAKVEFTLNEFCLKLSTDDGIVENRLSDITLADFTIDVTKRAYDLKVGAALTNFNVTDLYEGSNTEFIIKRSSDKHVATFTFANAKEGSSMYSLMSSDSLLGLNFKDLDVYFDQLTLSQFLRFGTRMQSIFENVQSRRKFIEAKHSKDTAMDIYNQARLAKQRRPGMSLSIAMDQLRLQLIDYGNTFSKLEMNNTEVRINNSSIETKVAGTLKNLKIIDTSGSLETSYQKIFGLEDVEEKDSSLITFSLQLKKELSGKEVGVPQFDKELQLEMKSIRFTFLRRFFTKLQVYFLNGPLMEALKAGSKRAAEFSVEAVKRQSQNTNMIKMSIVIDQPSIVVPKSSKSSDKLLATLDRLSISNRLHIVGGTYSEIFDIDIKDMGLQTINDLINVKPVVDKTSLKVNFCRAVVNPEHSIPDFNVDAILEPVQMSLSHEQYKMIFDILNNNIQDTAGLTNATEVEAKKLAEYQRQSRSLLPEGESSIKNEEVVNPLKMNMNFRFPRMDLTLVRNQGYDTEKDKLATLDMEDLTIDFSMKVDGSIHSHIVMKSISAFDHRIESTSQFRQFIHSQWNEFSTLDNTSINILEVTVDKVQNNILVDANLGTPTFIFVPEVALEIKNFFIDRGLSVKTPPTMALKQEDYEFEESGDIELFDDVTLSKDLVLKPDRRLLIRGPSGVVNVNGNGHSIIFDVTNTSEPLVLLDPNMKLNFQQILMKFFVSDVEAPKLFSANSLCSITCRPTEGVAQKYLFVEEREMHSPTPTIDKEPEIEDSLQNRIKVNGSFMRPRILFPEDASIENTKHLCIHTNLTLVYESDPYQKLKEQGKFHIQDLRAFYQSSTSNEYSANVIEPLDICIKLTTPNEIPVARELEIVLERDIGARISYNDVQLIKRIVDKFQQANSNQQTQVATGEEEHASDFDDDGEFESVESDAEEQEDFVDVDDGQSPIVTIDTPIGSPGSENGDELEDAPIELPVAKTEEIVEEKEASMLNISFKSTKQLTLMIVDDIQGFDIPLVNLFITNPFFRGGISFGNHMKIESALTVEVNANFYNVKIAAWEPILEKWNGKVRFERIPNYGNKLVPYSSNLTVTSGPESDLRGVNINVTQSMLETLLTTGRLWKDEFSKTSTGSVSKKFFPYTLRNHTGTTVEVTYFNSNGEETHHEKLKSGDQVGFSLGELTAHSISKHQVEITVPGFSPRIVNLKKVELVGISNKHGEYLCFENELIQGRKILTLRSGVKLFNNTTIPWQLGIELPERRTELFGEISPGESMGVPMYAIREGTMKIRPAALTEEYDWSSSGRFSFMEIMTHSDKARLLTCKSTDPREITRAYYAVVCVSVEREVSANELEVMKKNNTLQSLHFTIELRPPLLIENLLPRSIQFIVKDTPSLTSKKLTLHSGILKRGEKIVLYTANLKHNILLKTEFIEKGWAKKQRLALIHSNSDAMPRSRNCIVEDEFERKLFLHFDYKADDKSANAFIDVSVYVPYWIVNHTSLPITILEQSINPKAPGKKVAGHSALEENVDSSTPLMFSFSSQTSSHMHGKIAVSINDSTSQYFPLETTAGVANGVTIKSEKKQYDIGYHASIAPGKYRKIKVITISSQYVIANKTKYTMQISQQGSKEVETLLPDQRINFFWPNKDGPKKVRVRMKDSEFDWSSPFEFVNTTKDISLKFMHSKEPYKLTPYVLSARSILDRATLYVSIIEPKYPPFKFDNRLNFDVSISQSNLQRSIWWTMPSKKKTWYSWDDVTAVSQTIDIRVGKTTILHKFNPGKVTSRPKVIKLKESVFGLNQIYVSVLPNGPMFRIIFSGTPEQKVVTEETTKLRFATKLPQIGLSCINKRSQEIAYLSLRDIFFRYETSDVNEYCEASIKKLQIDNQSAEDVGIPVVLHHQSLDESNSFLSVSSTRSVTEDSIHLFHYASIAIQQFFLSLESNFVVLLVDFFSEMSFQQDDYDEHTTEKMLDFSPNLPTSAEGGKPFYFDILQLHPISFILTFNFTKMDLSFFKRNFFMQLLESAGLTLINCSDARIKLNALHMESRSFSSMKTLKDTIIKHYKGKILGELPKIVGSMDIIGNPLGLVMDVSFGARDFFYEPMKAIVHRPEDMGGVIRSIEKGTTSLVNHTLHGGFSTASKITSSIGKGLSALTFDEEYMQSREKSRKPVGLLEGVTDGGEAFKKGIIEGATGLVFKPLEGLEKEGGRGLMKGIAKGFLGVPVKPVTGLIDFATKTAEGVSNSNREIPTRERNIRTFGDGGRVIPYDHANAYCQMILHYTDCKGQTHRSFAFSEDERKIYIVTDIVVLCAYISNATLEWKHEISSITDVSYVADKGQVIIQGKSKGKSTLFSGSKSFSRIIQNTTDPDSIHNLYKTIMHLQKENLSHQPTKKSTSFRW